jgi:hypothetical protein
MNDHQMTTSRTDFVETWLWETPEGLGSFDTFDQIQYNISDLRKHTVPVQDLGAGLHKVDLNQTAYYWYERQGKIVLGVELDKRPQAWVVRLTGKNPKFQGQAPFASDLYLAVLRDIKSRSIRLLSDTQLSDEGLNIWKRLFDQGISVSVYDRNNPGQSFKTFDSLTDFDQYFKQDDSDFRRYQFVLSGASPVLAETRSFFHTRRFRELSGLALDDK